MAEPAAPERSPERILDLQNLEDLAYLEAIVDTAPRVLGMRDYPDGLTDHWREVLKRFIHITQEHVRADGG